MVKSIYDSRICLFCCSGQTAKPFQLHPQLCLHLLWLRARFCLLRHYFQELLRTKKARHQCKKTKFETSKFRISKMALQNLTIFYLLFTCFCCGAAVNLDSLTSMVYLDEWCGNTDRLPSSAFVARTSRRMCSLQDFARNLATSFCLILTNPPDLSWAVCSHGGRDGCQQWL